MANNQKLYQALYWALRYGRASVSDAVKLAFASLMTPTAGAAPDVGAIQSVLESKIATGSATSLTSATAKNVTSLTLTPGVWDVSGVVNHNLAGTTRTAGIAAIHTTTAAVPTDGTEVAMGTPLTTATGVDGRAVPVKRIVVASGTTVVYLTTSATFSAGTVAAFGSIQARRVA